GVRAGFRPAVRDPRRAAGESAGGAAHPRACRDGPPSGAAPCVGSGAREPAHNRSRAPGAAPAAGLPSGAVSDAPIGMFDSGVGGLTVARAVIDQLPNESIYYIGDTANAPYGPLPIATVRAHALALMDRLVGAGVSMLVIACTRAPRAR